MYEKRKQPVFVISTQEQKKRNFKNHPRQRLLKLKNTKKQIILFNIHPLSYSNEMMNLMNMVVQLKDRNPYSFLIDANYKSFNI